MLALFLATTGTAPAIVHRASSAARGLANCGHCPSFNSIDIIDNTLTGSDIKNESLTGRDIKNKSLTPADFRGSVRGPRGPAGATGANGAPGSQGPAGVNGINGTNGGFDPNKVTIRKTDNRAVPANGLVTIVVNCADNEIAIAGGYNADTGFAFEDHPTTGSPNRSWTVRIDNLGGPLGSANGWVVCALG